MADNESTNQLSKLPSSYWQIIHIMARCYLPTEQQCKVAIRCFFQSLCILMPNIEWRETMLSYMTQFPLDDSVLQNSDSIFLWAYNLHMFANLISKKTNLDYKTVLHNYSAITKVDWGNALWFCIHNIALENSSRIQSKDQSQFRITYKAFLSCLSVLIPCPVCRSHMIEYLSKHNIDNSFTSAQTLFKWTFDFHNSVNLSCKKPIIGLNDAMTMNSTK